MSLIMDIELILMGLTILFVIGEIFRVGKFCKGMPARGKAYGEG